MDDRIVEVDEKKRVFQGYFAVDQYKLRHSQFAGGLGPVIQREIFERGHAAAVIPYDPIRDQAVLIEQFRPGLYAAQSDNPWLTEIVAGIIDDGETVEDVCRREGKEEAGIEIGRLEYLSTQFMSPGATTESIALFIGECDSSTASGFHGLPQEGEDIRVFTKPWHDVVELALSGALRNAMSTVAILQANHRIAHLRDAWSTPI